MRIFWLPLLLALCVNVALDLRIWRRMRQCDAPAMALVARLHVVLAAVAHVALLTALLLPLGKASTSNDTMVAVMRLMWCYAMMYAPKLIWVGVDALSLVPAWPRWLRRGIQAVALIAALLVMGAMWQGMRVTPYALQVTHADVGNERLPAAFDGYRIVQFSDLHLGTYGTDTAFVAQCVDSINALRPDLIVFTGDLVSRTASEAEPFAHTLSRLRASDGVLAVLGNHDYDDYITMTPAQRRIDHEALCRLECNCRWTLLEGGSVALHRGADSIVVVGTENYSIGHTPDYSHLDSVMAAMPALGGCYTIMLQHNPQMWRRLLVPDAHSGRKGLPIDLTLSGHTHAMQMMVTLGGRRYSPAQLVYDEWGGLYSQGTQQLYVNTGLGMVGIPARIGATPEITLLTLRRGKAATAHINK